MAKRIGDISNIRSTHGKLVFAKNSTDVATGSVHLCTHLQICEQGVDVQKGLTL